MGWQRAGAAAMLVASVLWAAPAAAQVITAEISGTVMDSAGAVLPGATVTARNVDTGFERVGVTTAHGQYTLLSLPAGRYKVTAAMSGMQTVVREGFDLSLNQSVVTDFKLGV